MPDSSGYDEGTERSIEAVPDQSVDPVLYRLVVGALAAAMILMIIGGLVLAFVGKEPPPALIAIGAASGGALGGLLAPSPARG